MRPLLIVMLVAISALAVVGEGTAAAPMSADLAVSAVSEPDPVTIGSSFAYDLQVQNLGPDAATKTRVIVRLPREVDFVSASSSGGACSRRLVQSPRRVTCEVGTLPPPVANYSGPPEVIVSMIARRIGILTGSASVGAREKDTVSANDKLVLESRVLAPPTTCQGQTATIVGTLGDDALDGTPGPDVIAALNGNDTVFASSGRDLVCGGRGVDLIAAGSAADRIYGGAGGDILLGRGGPDLLRGMAGRDILRGDGGSDGLFGGRGFDRCRGGAGGDSLRSCERGDRRR